MTCKYKGCSSLTAVHITDLASWCNISFELNYCNPLYYAHHLYLNGEEVKDLVIPNSVTSIGYRAFQGCSGLTSITIPNSVTSINRGAFERCGLKLVTIGNSVTSIGDYAFSGCSGLTAVNITDLASWCNISFGYHDSNPLCAAHHLYLNGTEVKDLIIPNSVTSIKEYAFSGCSGLTSATIPNSVTNIGYNAFRNCSGLRSVTIGNGVTEIGTSSFSKCTNLETLYIGNNVTNIGQEAFSYCSELKDVYCYATKVPTTKSDVFKDCYIDYETLHVHEKSIGKYKAMTPWNAFGQIVPLTEEETGIDTIKSEATHTTDIYTLEGKQLPSLKKGINIIRNSDGTTKKVLVK